MIKKSLTAFLLFATSLFSQTISEKKSGLTSFASDLSAELQTHLAETNRNLQESELRLKSLYSQAMELYSQNAKASDYEDLLLRINEIREQRKNVESHFCEMAGNCSTDETYALWHQPEATLGQLVIDYGSNNFVYLIPQEISSIKLNIDSNLPVPRASWNEMLEIILTQNGVGIKQLNPYLRQLYFIKEDKSNLKLITSKRQDLEYLKPEERICFVITPEPVEIRRTFAFLDKFINPSSTALQMVGRDIIVIAQVAEIQDLLKLFDFVSMNRGDKEYKVISLKRVDAEEMSHILSAIFDHLTEPGPELEQSSQGKKGSSKGSSNAPRESSGLKIIALSHLAKAMFLVGTKDEIKRAEEIIYQVENQIGDAQEKVIYWYTAKHSDPTELADVLTKIYKLMIDNRGEFGESEGGDKPDVVLVPPPLPGDGPFMPTGNPRQPYPLRDAYDDGFYLNDRYVVDDSPVEIERGLDPNMGRDNFIVDPKTGSIVMVVEADILPKMKDLLKKLDVPKKMVQIEVLLFEKRIEKENNSGLNLLKIGSAACDENLTGFFFNDISKGSFCRGVTEFFISRKEDCDHPAFDAIYKFLLAQDDIQINANPSVLTINQTPAKIEIAEEISLNMGVVQVETNKGVTLKDSFVRANYGIKIEITPTIHLHDECDDDPLDYVTLVSAISFETIHPKILNRDRPDVTRRLINNEVRVADGQTVILGGLRRKISCDSKEAIPFLGELPGVGKLFSHTTMHDNSTEMFIFITPKIVVDPSWDLEKIRQEELCRRPGDIPSFLCCLVAARDQEKNRVMEESIRMLIGREPQCKMYPCSGEYDGR